MSFQIKVTKNELELFGNKDGSVIFTVANTSGRPIIPAKAELDVGKDYISSWLVIEGGEEKHFPVDTTQQYTVNIKIPEDAKPGSYSFRLNMIGIEDPDTDFSQGPLVSFNVKNEKGDAVMNKTPWLWIILAGVGFSLAAGLLLWKLFSSGDSTGDGNSEVSQLSEEVKNLKVEVGALKAEELKSKAAFQSSIVITSKPCSSVGAGWMRYSKASGKFLLGSSTSIVSGGVGGSQSITLYQRNLPKHNHKYKDVFHSEVKSHSPSQDSVRVPRNLGGNGSSDFDNVGFQISRNTLTSGGGAPLKYLPPYVSVNVCEFSG